MPEEEIKHAEISVGVPLYIQNRLLENGGDRWIGPFERSQPVACVPGGRSYILKSEVASQLSAPPCNDGQPVTVFTFKV
jgi:hypothetical protein